MRLGMIITLAASILCVGCGSKTDFQFGNTVPSTSPSMHNDLGNVQENEPMNVLAPISEAAPEVIPAEPVKVVQPKRLRPAINTTANAAPEKTPTEILAPAQQIAQPQLAQPAPTNWQPNEALLIRGNELLNGLQKEQGKKPSIAEMQKRLQSHMGLSAAQAMQVITALGLS